MGGQYAYLREALHPAVAFVYGWVLLLVIQTGGMAAGGGDLCPLFSRADAMAGQRFVGRSRGLALLTTAINCLGVRAGSRLQALLTLTAIAAIALLESQL